MADRPPAARTAFLSDLNAFHEAMRDGTTQDARQQRMYQHWVDLCATLSVNHILQDPSIPCIELLQVYSHHVWNSKYSKHQMNRLVKESISQAWGEIATSHLLGGFPSPRKPANSHAHTGLKKCLTRKLKTYSLEDPPVRQEKATPWESFTPSSLWQPDPPTPYHTTSPTWSQLASTSASVPVNTQSAS